ncbi:MAG: hypothetical protein UY89_C0002G0010 [Parcubacteria group bacterium GW2011_GWA1_54_9]|nr:MAG: hypothetical protein UY89_C0002G0010 [Parcubacteria group bacterium GW2011_GWA1_54_9]KKW41967.1 MAG: hypothetical protein UY91_C0008G0010 [Parcubacteria group bacterium GW2011_GWB1_55_9]
MHDMPLMLKKISVFAILASFLAIAFFSFTSMTYGPDGSMRGDCPFSAMGASLCPPSALPGAIHHLFAYQSFISAPVNFAIETLIIILLLAVSIAIFPSFLFHPPAYDIPPFVPRSPTPFTSYDRKVRRWLSLFEHSPSY